MALYVRPRGDGHAIVAAVSRRVDNTVYIAITVAVIVIAVVIVVVTIAVLHDGVFSTVN